MPQKLAIYLDLIRFDRPAGWLLLLWPTLTALWVAAGGFPGWHLLAVFTLGTILMRSAGCCINDVADREFDKHVKRTANRPVTSGRIAPREALAVGAGLAVLAFMLVLTTNLITVLLSFAALAITLAYPFAKRYVAMPQAVLGVAFSFGIPMAFAAVRGGDSLLSAVRGGDSLLSAVRGGDSLFAVVQGGDSLFASLQTAVPPLAWMLLLGNLFWVLAYDTEYAMVDRDDDLRLGMRTSAITLGRFDVAAVMLFYALYLGIFMVFLPNVSVKWPFIAIYSVALVVCIAQLLWHYTLIRSRSREGCFAAFRANHWLGASVFAAVALSYAV